MGRHAVRLADDVDVLGGQLVPARHLVARLAPPLVAAKTVSFADAFQTPRDKFVSLCNRLGSRAGRRASCRLDGGRVKRNGSQQRQVLRRGVPVHCKALRRRSTRRTSAEGKGRNAPSMVGAVRRSVRRSRQLSKRGRVLVAGTRAQHGIKADHLATVQERLGPTVGDVLVDNAPLPVVPIVSFAANGLLQRMLGLVVPADAYVSSHLVSRISPGWRGGGYVRGIPRPKDVQALEPGRVLGSRRPAGVAQRLHELVLVEVLDVADGQDAQAQGGVDEDVVAELGGDGEPVEDEGLDVLQDVAPAEALEDAAQRARVEVILGHVLVHLDVAPDLAAMVDAVDVELRRPHARQVKVSEDARGAAQEELAEGGRSCGEVEDA